METQIDLLMASDVSSAQSLVEIAGWNQLPADWQRMLDREPLGCFKATAAGRLLGTVTTIVYGAELAWIGMMLVHPDSRRQGIGKRLMRQAIHFLKARGVKSIALDATPAGRPLYEQLGFKVSAEWQRWRRDMGVTISAVQPQEDVDCALIHCLESSHRELDRCAFGIDRWTWIERLAEVSHVVASEHGFGLLRPGRTANYLGPVIADDRAQAEILIQDLLQRQLGPCLWDVPPGNAPAESLAKQFGFEPARVLYRMWLDQPCPTGQPSSVFAICDPATG